MPLASLTLTDLGFPRHPTALSSNSKRSALPFVLPTEYGGGGLLDLGVYLTQVALMIFGKPPTSWSTKGFLAETGNKSEKL